MSIGRINGKTEWRRGRGRVGEKQEEINWLDLAEGAGREDGGICI